MCLSDLEAGVQALAAAGCPATFLLAFDECWTMVHQAAPLVEAATGNACNMVSAPDGKPRAVPVEPP